MKPGMKRKGSDGDAGYPAPVMGKPNLGRVRPGDATGTSLGRSSNHPTKTETGVFDDGDNMDAGDPFVYGNAEHDFGPDNADTSWHESNTHPQRSRGHELEVSMGAGMTEDETLSAEGGTGKGTGRVSRKGA